MQRWQNLTAIGAVICAVIGATRVPFHETLTYAAVALLGIVAISILLTALQRRKQRSDTEERARRIREQRKGRHL